MKRDGWYLTTLGHAFSPDEQTLRDMDYVFNNISVYLTSRETNELNPRIPPITENYVDVSPPRRRRRICDDN